MTYRNYTLYNLYPVYGTHNNVHKFSIAAKS